MSNVSTILADKHEDVPVLTLDCSKITEVRIEKGSMHVPRSTSGRPAMTLTIREFEFVITWQTIRSALSSGANVHR